MNLQFKLNKQKLIRIDDEELATFARNYIDVTFDFDEVWANLKKYCLFVTPNENKYVVKLGYGKVLSCKIPNEVLQNAFFKISVFADDLLTSTQEMVLISSSGYTSEIDDLDDGDMLEGNLNIDEGRRRHYDEDMDERCNRFEIVEHPYT